MRLTPRARPSRKNYDAPLEHWSTYVIVAAITGAVLIGTQGTAEEPADKASSLPACATEDDPSDCYWDASVRGNGQGASFVVIDGVVYTAR